MGKERAEGWRRGTKGGGQKRGMSSRYRKRKEGWKGRCVFMCGIYRRQAVRGGACTKGTPTLPSRSIVHPNRGVTPSLSIFFSPPCPSLALHNPCAAISEAYCQAHVLCIHRILFGRARGARRPVDEIRKRRRNGCGRKERAENRFKIISLAWWN